LGVGDPRGDEAERDLRIPAFGRDFFGSGHTFSRIGRGQVGGKARGLVSVRNALDSQRRRGGFLDVDVSIPRSIVLTTEVFDDFIRRNDLLEIALSDLPDDRIAHAFQKAEFPAEFVGDLHALIENVHVPLAVRSSSLLEDELLRPFAGVYETKMTPNNQPDAATRFRKLVEAIKFVYASTYFRAAKDYIGATDRSTSEERMAVLIQEVVGARRGDRFYPDVSGVGRSYNFYPQGDTRPDEGVVNLALGLGKTIVDGGVTWSYVPSRPAAPPPFACVGDLMKGTQLDFWAVNMAGPIEHDPVAETEYLVQCGLAEADYDGTLERIASTYDPRSDRLYPGTGRPGPRVLNFAPLLGSAEEPFNDIVRKLLALAEGEAGTAVETEFALVCRRTGFPGPARLGFLQVRPMVVSDERVQITGEELSSPDLVAASTRAMGNGVVDSIRDIVYVRRESFDSLQTRAVAGELGVLNRSLLGERRPYLLIGFGRWGSGDPAFGIPVVWGQIAGAKVIVEATLPAMNVEPSQGSHFFHNITSFRVAYFQIHHDDIPGIAWSWLERQPVVAETAHVRHVRLDGPLHVKVDGTTGRGAIWSSRRGR
jgi:hypothetical protein